jgi:GNAT superfamily N-acetyltransferase
VKRLLEDGYELDDDPRRIDHEAVYGFLSAAYWAIGRPREVVDATIDGAARVVGLYHEDRQVGFVRIVSDRYTVAYVCDVYVLQEHRGRGLGFEMMTFALREGPLVNVRKWGLHTSNAHSLYRRLGFDKPDGRYMELWNPGRDDGEPEPDA